MSKQLSNITKEKLNSICTKLIIGGYKSVGHLLCYTYAFRKNGKTLTLQYDYLNHTLTIYYK